MARTLPGPNNRDFIAAGFGRTSHEGDNATSRNGGKLTFRQNGGSQLKSRFGTLANYVAAVHAINPDVSLTRLQDEFENEILARDLDVHAEILTLDEAKKQLAQIERDIAALGPVNQRALEMYEEQMKREGELLDEVKRLQADGRRVAARRLAGRRAGVSLAEPLPPFEPAIAPAPCSEAGA